MGVTREPRNQDDTARRVLTALADRPEDGMTVFELRAKVDADIDTIEEALATLKEADDIDVRREGGRTVIVPDEHALERIQNGTGEADEEAESNWLEEIRRRFPF